MCENIPSKYNKLIERAKTGRSRKDSIHVHCLECMGYEREAVRGCTSKNCVFWFHRPYKTDAEARGSAEKRQIKSRQSKITGMAVDKVIKTDKGRLRLKVELLPEL